jgi:hypothetical protein
MHDDAQKIKEQTISKRGFFWAVTPSLDFSIALAMMVFKEFILIKLLLAFK